jgi:hypothetical protein
VIGIFKAVRGASVVVLVAAGSVCIVVLAGCGTTKTRTIIKTVSSPTTASATTSSLSEPTTESKTTTSQNASGGPDECKVAGIDSQHLNQGTCTENGLTFNVVNRGTELTLAEMNARYEGYTTTNAINKPTGTTVAQGVFVIIKLSVMNKLDRPARFDANSEATLLLLGGRVYTEDFNAENNPNLASFVWESEAIQPGNWLTGAVVFDIPTSMVSDLNTDGNLDVRQFSDEGEEHPTHTIGVFRTYH